MRSAWRNKQLLRSIEHKPQSLQGQFYYNLLSLRGFCFKWLLTLQWDRKQSNRNSTWFYIHKVTVHTQMGGQGIALRLLRCSERSALLGGCHAVAFSSYQKSPPPLHPWHWKSGENLDFCVWYALSYIAHFSSVSRRLWELSSQLKLTRAKVVKICSNKKRQL